MVLDEVFTHCTLLDTAGAMVHVYVCEVSAFASLCMCESDNGNCSKSEHMRFMASKGEADWIMGKKRRNAQGGGRE